MKHLLQRLHARLGDFWWYSLMLFMAMRAADVLNVFVGLWLVPKYVEPAELGAVMPLTQFANFLAIPIAVFASTFRNELTSLAVNRKFGQMKTLMRGVFIATAIFLFLAIVLSRILLPAFLERIRIAEGSLGIVILVSSFVSTVSPIYTNALQSLKKFKANSLISLIGAPVRLLTMLVTMPLRALTGYFVGQTAPAAFSIFGSVIALRKELSVKAEPYWTKDIVKRFAKLLIIFGVSTSVSSFVMLAETTIIRQRLNELDSAAYYLATRFSEITTFVSSVLMFTIFPFAAELAKNSKDLRPLIVKCMLTTAIFGSILAFFFIPFSDTIFHYIPNGDKYAAYAWSIPALVGIATIQQCAGFYTMAETGAGRFQYMFWTTPLHAFYAIALFAVTGHGYFTGIIPANWTEFLATHNIFTLETMLWWMAGFQLVRLLYSSFAMLFQRRTIR